MDVTSTTLLVSAGGDMFPNLAVDGSGKLYGSATECWRYGAGFV